MIGEQKILCSLSFVSIHEKKKNPRILWSTVALNEQIRAQVNGSTPPFLREVGELPT